MLEKDEFLGAEVTGAVGAQCPNAKPRVPGGLREHRTSGFLQGGSVEQGAVDVLGPEHLQTSSPFSFPTLNLGIRTPDMGSSLPQGKAS